MASEENITNLSEWEFNDNGDEVPETDFVEGEETGVKVAWNKCNKLKINKEYHETYMTIHEALNYRKLSVEEQNDFASKKNICVEDKLFLSSQKGAETIEHLSNAVVRVTAKKGSQTGHGTGFFISFKNGDVAVITNSHTVRSVKSGKGIDFSNLKPNNITVTAFQGSETKNQLKFSVERIELTSLPDSNKAENVLTETMKKNLLEEGTTESEPVMKCDIAIGLLESYFKRRDSFLDYAFLYLNPLVNDDDKVKLDLIQPLKMKPFEILKNFRNVNSIETPDPRRNRYPQSLRLFSISHPHGHEKKQLSFGEMKSTLTHAFFLNMSYGQNDTGMLSGKEPFVEHSITTCRGSSGAPIFFYILNHDTGEIEVDDAVYFLHFGEATNVDPGLLHGKSVSFSTIIKNLGFQGTHEKLAKAFEEVKEYEKESE